MKIEKDAEWNRLEGRVGELQDKLKAAKSAMEAHARKTIAAQAGVALGETVVDVKDGRFLIVTVDPSYFRPWFWGRKLRKDGQPSSSTQRIDGADKWTIVK